MKTISSRHNPLYRQWLADAKQAGRAGHGIWLEGTHLCQAWLEHRGQPQWALVALEEQGHPEIDAITAQVVADRQVWLPQKLMAGLSSLVSTPAIMFVASHEVASFQAVQAAQAAQASVATGSCVLLDDVQDPGNVGSLLRTSAAAGIRSVYAGPGTAACWSPKVLRAGQGAQFALRINESVNLDHLIRRWRESDGQTDNKPKVLATTLDESATSIYKVDLTQDVAWLFGHEGRGVSPELIAQADGRVFIPHDRLAVESLNVASAAAICLFEQRRQCLHKAQH